MADAASNLSGEQRRRSTRITQTVPIVVRGVDLLGQPFEENTSTLVFSFHGCKYSSKHHLPKNTWITMEVSQREKEEGPRCVRARVVWIHRPRTVREPFQIGVELETPGNFWGLAFPPADWIRTRPSADTEHLSPAVLSFPLTPQGQSNAPPLGDPGGAELGPESIPSLLGTLLARSPTPSAPFLPGGASADEESPLLRELRAEFRRQAEGAIREAAARADEIVARAEERIDQRGRATAEAFYEKWREEFEKQTRGASEQISAELTQQVASAQQELRAAFRAELDEKVAETRQVVGELEHRAETLREETRAAESARSRLEEIRDEMDALARPSRQRVKGSGEGAAHTAVGEDWKGQLESEMGVARAQWEELLQSSLDSAAQRFVTHLADSSHSALEGASRKMAERLEEFSQPFRQAAGEAHDVLANVRTALEQEISRAKSSLEEIEQAATRMSQYSTQLEAASQDALNELHRRLEAVLAGHAAELNRRAEGLLAGMAERAYPSLEAAGHQFIARTIKEVESRLTPFLERAPELARELAAREIQAEESLRVHRERLRQASEQHQREQASSVAATLAQLRNDFEAARRGALEKWNQEIDTSCIRATHAALESVIQGVAWHEREASSRLEALVEDALQKAAAGLEGKTDDASRRFTAQVEERGALHAHQIQSHLQDAADDVVARARQNFAQAAELAAASFETALQGASEMAAERVEGATGRILEAKEAQLAESAEEVRRKLDAAATDSQRSYQERIAACAEQALAKAAQSFSQLLDATLVELRARSGEREREWVARLDRLAEEAARKVEVRLETGADSWVLASVRRLEERGGDVIDGLTRASGQAMRCALTRAFDDLARAMREQLLAAGTAGPAGTSLSPPDSPGASAESPFKF